MSTTTNSGWEIPDDTDLVKDGAASIRELGQDIDTTVFGLSSGALTLISATTIGTAVTSVAVTSAFSATYDNYKIIINGGSATADNELLMILGATTTGYYWAGAGLNFSSGSVSGAGNNGAQWTVGGSVTNGIFADIELKGPQLAQRTVFEANLYKPTTSGFSLPVSGFLNNATQYTGFTVSTPSGTMTGGTIRVYGYKNS